MDKPKEKKPIINISVPDAVKVIGVRTFYLGIVALLSLNAGVIIAFFNLPDTVFDKGFFDMYFDANKWTLIIILGGKIVAGKVNK